MTTSPPRPEIQDQTRCSHRTNEGISTNGKRNLKSPAIELPKLATNRSHNFAVPQERNNVVLKGVDSAKHSPFAAPPSWRLLLRSSLTCSMTPRSARNSSTYNYTTSNAAAGDVTLPVYVVFVNFLPVERSSRKMSALRRRVNN